MTKTFSKKKTTNHHVSFKRLKMYGTLALEQDICGVVTEQFRSSEPRTRTDNKQFEPTPQLQGIISY